MSDFVALMRARLQLEQRAEKRISLDEIGEVIGEEYAHPAEIEALIQSLEEDGYELLDSNLSELVDLLRAGLKQARELKLAGKKADLATLAEELGVEPRALRVAFLYGEVLSRG